MTTQEMLRTVRGIAMGAVIAVLVGGFASVANAQCAGPKEGGKWWNASPKGDPISLEVSLDSCSDQVLNGQPSGGPVTYGVKAFVLQSSGNLYQRPKVKATYQKLDGRTWLFASVPTGGYVDRIWMRRDDAGGQERLYVYIKHESLDSKPSAESRYTYTRQRAAEPPPVKIIKLPVERRILQRDGR